MSSKKIIIAVIALAVLLIGAIVGYVLVDKSKTQEENASQAEIDALQLLSFDPDQIDSVSIDIDEGHFLITAETGEWAIKETDYPHPIKLNTYYVNAVVNYMSDLTALQKFDIEADKLGSYGLDKPAVVTCGSGSESYTIYVGTASVTEEYWYVMMPDDSHVYAVDYTRGGTLRGGTIYLKNRNMLESSDVAIDSFLLKKGSETVVDLVIKDGLWAMQAPIKGANVNSASVNSMLTSLTRVEYAGFAGDVTDPSQLAEYGLDNPAYTMKITCKGATEELLFAPEKTTGGGMYVLNKASGQVATLDLAQISFLNLKPEELLIKTLVELPYTSASALEVQVDDTSFTMEMDAQAGTCSLNGKDLSGMSDNVKLLHRNLYDTVGTLAWEELRFDMPIPEDVEPDCSFTFTDKDGAKTVLLLYKTDDENIYRATINGQDTFMTVRRRSLTGNTGVLSFYEKLTDAIAEG